MSEVYNGGHYQYFTNKVCFDHLEVLNSLEVLGATEQAQILREALRMNPVTPETIARNVEEFIQGYQDTDLGRFDKAFYRCKTKIEDYLGAYLDRHESEFVQWIP